MGTLTADMPRLATHCDHKLPTSCRLTSTPLCCACADNRPHSSTYRIYIDGVGFVQRGTRWQSYCWFCKVFWNARLAASRMPVSQSQIPDTPNQTEFLARWFEFHQGYRIVQTSDGREQRIAVVGEPLKDVDPGHLPRTLEELRTGRRASDQLQHQLINIAMASPSSSPPGPSLEETLDELLQEAMAETELPMPEHTPASDENTVAGEQPSPPRQPNFEMPHRTHEPAAVAGARLDNPGTNGQDFVEQFEETATARDRVARRQYRRLRRQQNTPGNLARVFGTREEVQSDEYVSPIASMFTRVSQWGQRAEAQRRESNSYEVLNRQPQHAQHDSIDTNAENSPAPRASIGNIVRASGLRDVEADGYWLRLESAASDVGREALLQTIQDGRDSSLGGMIRGAEPPETITARLWEQQAHTLRLRQESRYQDDFRQSMSSPSALEQPTGESRRPHSLTRISEGDGERTRVLMDESEARLPLPDFFTPEQLLPVINGGSERERGGDELTPGGARETNLEVTGSQFEAWLELGRANRNFIESRQAEFTHSRTLDLLGEARGNLERSMEGLEVGDEMTIEESDRSHGALNDAETAFVVRSLGDATFRPEPLPAIRGLDSDDRPEAKRDEEMVVKLECRICYAQIADTACLPCGHLAMCQWCADQAVPVTAEDRTRPRNKSAKCPVCRVKVKQRVRIFAS